MNTSFFLFNPIFQYDNIVEKYEGDPHGDVSADKFKTDIETLFAEGYTSLSLKEYYGMSQKSNEELEIAKFFTVVFSGGKLDIYKYAFPIVKKLGIKVSFFLEIEKVGTSEEGSVDYFGWEEARIMLDSGLVNFYLLWEPLKKGESFKDIVSNKIDILNTQLKGNGSIFAYSGCDHKLLPELDSLGINSLVTDTYKFDAEDTEKGAIPAALVGVTEDIRDVIAEYCSKCSVKMIRSESVKSEIKQEIVLYDTVLNSSITLPVCGDPLVKNYLHHAVPLSVIGATRPDRAERIVLSEYIDFIYQPSMVWLDFHADPYASWDYLTCQTITGTMLKANRISPVEYMINALKEGFYCDIWLDAYYIPCKSWYKKSHFSHGLLIYGYDGENREFLCLTYANELHYIKVRVKAEDMIAGTNNEYFAHIKLLTNNYCFKIPYDIKRLYDKLYNYLHNICYDDPSRFNKNVRDQSVQIEAGKAFADDLDTVHRKHRYIPLALTYTYVEHKRIMMWRINYIAEKEKLLIPELGEMSNAVAKSATFVMNALIKYNMKGSDELMDSIVKNMRSINRIEEKAISELLHRLEIKYEWLKKELS